MISIPFQFSQRFEFPARAAFAWATSYDPGDIVRMGLKGKRAIKCLAADAIELRDTIETEAGRVQKHRLVRIYPDLKLWTNTRLSSPNKHSQFLYRIVPEGREASRLDFVGLLLVDEDEAPKTERGIAALGKKLAREDALLWKHLARAMKTELGNKEGSRTPRR